MIYYPATASILTVGHIKCLEWLKQRDQVIVGLLTDKALKGYKKIIVPYEDRKYVMDTIAIAIGGIIVVPQESLDPSKNIEEYSCTGIASGDGWEPVELRAIHTYNLMMIDIRLPGEVKKKYSSSKILQIKK